MICNVLKERKVIMSISLMVPEVQVTSCVEAMHSLFTRAEKARQGGARCHQMFQGKAILLLQGRVEAGARLKPGVRCVGVMLLSRGKSSDCVYSGTGHRLAPGCVSNLVRYVMR